jgi:hypothetical protein
MHVVSRGSITEGQRTIGQWLMPSAATRELRQPLDSAYLLPAFPRKPAQLCGNSAPEDQSLFHTQISDVGGILMLGRKYPFPQPMYSLRTGNGPRSRLPEFSKDPSSIHDNPNHRL